MALLKAVMDPSGFAAGASKVQAEAKKTGNSLRTMGVSSQKANQMAGKLKSTIIGLAGGFTALQIIRSAISNIVEFEASMVKVRNVTGATEGQFKQLTEKARELGAATMFSASQAADALLFLGRAGFSVNESLASVGAVMDLAAVSGMDLGQVADITSNVLRQFGLEAQSMDRVVDALNNTANNSNTTIDSLAQGLIFAGPVAKMAGRSLEETAAAIGVLGDAGIPASMAGRGLRTIMLSLASATPDAKEAIKELGLSIEDVSPATNDFATVSERLYKAFAKIENPTRRLSLAGTIFGKEGVSSAGVLMAAFARQRELQQIMDEKKGSTHEQSAAQMETIAGKAKALASAYEELTLQSGDGGAAGGMKVLLDVLTDVMRDLGGVEGSATGAARSLEGIGAGIAVFYGLRAAIGLGTLAMSAFTAALAGNPFGLLAVSIATVIGLMVAFRSEMEDLRREAEKRQHEGVKKTAFGRLAGVTDPKQFAPGAEPLKLPFGFGDDVAAEASEKIAQMSDKTIKAITEYNKEIQRLSQKNPLDDFMSPETAEEIGKKTQLLIATLEADGAPAAIEAAKQIKDVFLTELGDLPTANIPLKLKLEETFKQITESMKAQKLFGDVAPEAGADTTQPAGVDVDALRQIQQMQDDLEQEIRLSGMSDESRQVAIGTTRFLSLAEQAYGDDVQKTHEATMAYQNGLKQLNAERQKAIAIQQEAADAEAREAAARQNAIQQMGQEANMLNQLQSQTGNQATGGAQSLLSDQQSVGEQLGAAIAHSFVSNITSGKADFSGLANAVMDQMVTKPMGDMFASALSGILGPLQSPSELNINAGTVYLSGNITGGGGSGGGGVDYGMGGMEGFGGFTGDPAGGGFFAKGAIFDFAGGGIFDREQRFSFGNAKRGRLAERGPEALMPVRQMPGGDLGVQASLSGSSGRSGGEGNPVSITTNQYITTPDAGSFRKARAHIEQDQQRAARRMQ